MKKGSKVKIVKNILWSLAPLLISIMIYLGWIILFDSFRYNFDFPWGYEGYDLSPDWIELVVFNTVQFIFIAGLFFATLYIYNRCSRKAFHLPNERWWHLAFISISWALWSYFAFVGALATCCPGLFADVIIEFYWLTIPEFIGFYFFGQVYLILKIREIGNLERVS